MPELPEIEALRGDLAVRLDGHPVTAVRVFQFALVKTFDPPVEALVDERIEGLRRHGKHLLLDWTNDLTLAIHLGIGGRIVPSQAGRKPGRGVSLEIAFDDESALRVVELGTKKRSSVHLLRAADVDSHLAALGVDALSPDLTVERLADLLAVERSQMKRFLTDQHRIAGIGNAYSDEILWDARLSPLRLSPTLEGADVERLHAAIGSVLRTAMEKAVSDNYLMVARGDERGFFQVHRREKAPCPRCGEAIASIHFADNSLQYCPSCQVEGRRYADRRLSRLLK